MIVLSRTSDTYIPLKISANGSDDYILVGNDTVTLEIKYSGNVVLKKEFTVLDCDSYGKLTIVVTESEVRYLSNLNYTYSITMVLNGKTIEYSTGKLMIQDRRNSVSSFSSIYNNKYDITNVINDSLSKADTVSNWQSSTVILPYGYIAISFDDDSTKKIKIGDGEKKWSELDFFNGVGGGVNFEFGRNFKPHNILVDYPFNTSDFDISIQGEEVNVTVHSNLGTTWYAFNKIIQFYRGKMYKLWVDKFDGYGRFGVSHTKYPPYNHENYNAYGQFIINDNRAICNSDSIKTNLASYFYINTDGKSSAKGGFWFCSDLLYNGAKNAHTFKIGLYEEE